MSTKYHISNDGLARKCEPKATGVCGLGQDASAHMTAEEAAEHNLVVAQGENPIVPKLQKKKEKLTPQDIIEKHAELFQKMHEMPKGSDFVDHLSSLSENELNAYLDVFVPKAQAQDLYFNEKNGRQGRLNYLQTEEVHPDVIDDLLDSSSPDLGELEALAKNARVDSNDLADIPVSNPAIATALSKNRASDALVFESVLNAQIGRKDGELVNEEALKYIVAHPNADTGINDRIAQGTDNPNVLKAVIRAYVTSDRTLADLGDSGDNEVQLALAQSRRTPPMGFTLMRENNEVFSEEVIEALQKRESVPGWVTRGDYRIG